MKNINDQIVIYLTEDGNTAIDVQLENETVWLKDNQMALLFDRDEKTIRKHIMFRIWANRVLKEYLVKGFAIKNKLTA